MSIKKAFLLPAFALLAALMQAQSSQTIAGTVTDAMCGKKHMMQGVSAAQCTRECVKSGSDYALVVRDKIYIIKGDKAAIDRFAGVNVVVKGKIIGSTVTVESIKAAM